MTMRMLLTTATLFASAAAAHAHTGDHSALASGQLVRHFANSPSHLPVFMLLGSVLAGIAALHVARTKRHREVRNHDHPDKR